MRLFFFSACTYGQAGSPVIVKVYKRRYRPRKHVQCLPSFPRIHTYIQNPNSCKMKSFFVVCLLSVVAMAAARPEDKYTDRYDNVNVDEIITNKRLLEAYVNCALETGKCTSEGTELKKHIKDALETECSKCTEVQKKETEHVIGHLINKEEAFWTALSDKYDPERKYTKKYEDRLHAIKA